MADKYCYKHPHPAVTADIVIFTVRDDALQLLLIQRGVEPFKNAWALPGGFVRMDEDLAEAARRELQEETGLQDIYLEQFGAYGRPERDPRERVITIAYYAIIATERLSLSAGTDAAHASWFDYKALPDLAFDHKTIISDAYEKLVDKLRRSTVVLQFLPKEFTLTQLQRLHEIILGETIDKRNFRKWVESLDFIRSTGRKTTGASHRPAELYTAVEPGKVVLVKEQPRRYGKVRKSDIEKLNPLDAYETGLRDGSDGVIKQIEKTLKSIKH
jgi:8-oxo-dGTP diphosphatase